MPDRILVAEDHVVDRVRPVAQPLAAMVNLVPAHRFSWCFSGEAESRVPICSRLRKRQWASPSSRGRGTRSLRSPQKSLRSRPRSSRSRPRTYGRWLTERERVESKKKREKWGGGKVPAQKSVEREAIFCSSLSKRPLSSLGSLPFLLFLFFVSRTLSFSLFPTRLHRARAPLCGPVRKDEEKRWVARKRSVKGGEGSNCHHCFRSLLFVPPPHSLRAPRVPFRARALSSDHVGAWTRASSSDSRNNQAQRALPRVARAPRRCEA